MMTKQEERQIVYNKFKGHCAYCGELLTSGWHIDHIKPVQRYKRLGNSVVMYRSERDTLENKFPSCASCNINKHGMSIEQFRFQIERFIHSLNTNITQYKIAKRYGLVIETKIPVVFYFEKVMQEKVEQE